MVYENIEIDYANFCLSPRSANELGYIDHDNDIFRLIQAADGSLVQGYSLDNGVNEIKSMEYTGPRNLGGSLNQLGNELPFFTLERISSSQCKIKRWKLIRPLDGASFDLQNTITLTTAGSNYFDCYAMAVENYETTFANPTTTGTAVIDVTSVSGIEIGDVLLLGPSGDTDNLYAFEYVTVTGVIGNDVYITSSGAVPPHYEYVGGDPITFWKNIYLFSDIGQNNDSTKGSMYTIDANTGSILDVDNSGIYNGVRAASWSRDYQLPGFVKNTNLLYVNPNNYQIQKSQAMSNISSDSTTVLPVYDLIFDNAIIFRLQTATTLANDSGVKTTYSWGTYNYQQDSILPRTFSIVLYPVPDGIVLNDESVTLKAVVRDQFGVGLNGKTVTFSDSPDVGEFTPLEGTATTNANGVASIPYKTDYFNPTDPPPDTLDIEISAYTDGSSATYNGSAYVYDGMNLLFHKRFDSEVYLDQPSSGVSSDMYVEQIEDVSANMYLKSYSKFQFPGGHWTAGGAPNDDTRILEQLEDFESEQYFDQIDNDFTNDVYADQLKEKSNDTFISQLYVSRHASTGHQDTVDIDQFQFIEDAIPPFFSEKNPVNTNIYIRLRPFAFDLNAGSLVFRVREVSYAGDTGYIDVTGLCTITTFDAGGGLLGLDITYNPVVDFHHNAVVYVSIEVYDNAPTPNIILTDYWFKIIPDFRAPYITNEDPGREEEDVLVSTDIEFDLFDAGVGVDLSTLEVYVNNRYVVPAISTISGGYHVSYNPPDNFYYGETVEITVKVRDASDNANQLYDTWRFYCEGSTGPWIDPDSFYPRNCSKGVFRKLDRISFNVYGVNDTGVDETSIMVTIGGKNRNVTITPVIYRVD